MECQDVTGSLNDEQVMWELASNSGWERITCSERGVVWRDDDAVVRLQLDLRTSFWDRLELERTGLFETALTAESDVTLAQVVVSLTRLNALRDALREWLDAPREITIELGVAHVTTTVSFGAMSRTGHLECALIYETSKTRIATRFVSDQSCVRHMYDGLNRWLGSVSADARSLRSNAADGRDGGCAGRTE